MSDSLNKKKKYKITINKEKIHGKTAYTIKAPVFVPRYYKTKAEAIKRVSELKKYWNGD